MKKILKIIILLLVSLAFLYTLFVVEESIRIANNMDSKPLIIFNDTTKDEKVTYYSLGFKVINVYGYNEEDEEEYLIGQEIWLFNNFMLWGWIS